MHTYLTRAIYSINFPDLQGCYTSGDDMTDAVYMAQDVQNLTLYELEQDDKPIPKASRPQDISISKDQFVSVIVVNTEAYRRIYENKSVKKMLTIPAWLNDKADKEGINFSHVLQRALKEKLHVEGA